MKKEIIVVIILIVLIIILNIFTQNKISNFFDELINELDKIENNIVNNNSDKNDIQSQLDNILEKWNNEYDKFAVFVEHDELEKIEIEIITINTDFKIGEYNRCVEEIEKCKGLLENLKEKDSFRLVNIF